METIPGQLDELRDRLTAGEKRMDERLTAGDQRMAAIEYAVAENTLLTKSAAEGAATSAKVARETAAAISAMAPLVDDIRAAVVTGKTVTKLVKWLGGIAAAIVALAAAWQQFWPRK